VDGNYYKFESRKRIVTISPEDIKALKQAQQCVQQMHNLLPIETRDTAPASVVGALLTVSLQHCDSVLILLQTGANNASAEALLRPTIESVLRLAWLGEDHERAKQIMAKKINFPSFSRLMGRFVKKPAIGSVGDTVKNLHDLTHAGMMQLIQHFSEESKKRTPLEEAASLRLSAFLVVMLAMIACGSFSRFTKRKETGERLAAVALKYFLGAVADTLGAVTGLVKKRTNSPELRDVHSRF
jgi:hypothetical protein